MAEAVRLLLRRRGPVVLGEPQDEAAFKRHLLESGLMSRLPTPPETATRPPFHPVTLRGESLSSAIIRERR